MNSNARSTIGLPAIVLLGLLGTACSGAESVGNDEPAAPQDTQPLTAIAEVALSDSYRLAFYEPQPGMLLLSETGRIGVDIDSKVKAFDSAAKLYRDLVPEGQDKAIIDVLTAADERAAAFNARQPTSDPKADEPPVDEGRVVEKHSNFLNGNQCQLSSFEGGYCSLKKSDQITWSDTGWQWCTAHFRSTVFNHQYVSTNGSATHTVFYYGTKGDFWAQVADTWVAPNTWQSWHSTWKYVKATTGRTSGQVAPGNHDQCVLKDPLNSPGLFGGCETIVLGCAN
jgi:hypothetical protein